jgi:hypothetical protein
VSAAQIAGAIFFKYTINSELYVSDNCIIRSCITSPNIIKMIKSRRIRWPGHVAHIGENRMHTLFWWVSKKENLDMGG